MFNDLIDRLKAIRLHFTVTAVLEVVLGVVLLIWPLTVVGLLAKILGVVLIVTGLVELVAKIFDDTARAAGILIGLILVVLGGWIVIHPAGIISIIPIIIGVGLIAHGVQNFSLALDGKKYSAPRWGWMLFASVFTMVLGVICIVCALRVVDIAVRVGGFFLIYDGLASILMVHRVNKASRDVDSVIIEETDI